MDKDTRKYFAVLAWVMVGKLAILGTVVGVFVLGHMYRGATYSYWLEFISMLQ